MSRSIILAKIHAKIERKVFVFSKRVKAHFSTVWLYVSQLIKSKRKRRRKLKHV